MKNFINQLKEILGENISVSTKENEIKVNTTEELSSKTLTSLIITCNDYETDFKLKRSGPGIRINFTEKVKAEG